MKKTGILCICFFTVLLGCSDTTGVKNSNQASAEKQFVWKGLNTWYYWQAHSALPNLADNRFGSERDFHRFLNNYETERHLFYDLLLPVDNFSWFIDDYEEHEKARQGISTSFGFRFGLVCMDDPCFSNSLVFGYVQYVLEGSPAGQAGLERGDIFTRINGTQLTAGNYQNLLRGDSYALGMAVIENGILSNTTQTVSVTAVELQEDPVFLYKVMEAGASRVGYLVYNSFRFNFHEKLNEVFGFFKQEGIDELVIDLRYNGGGAIITNALLASMISGLNPSNVFTHLIFNDKQSDQNSTLNFLDKLSLLDEQGNLLSDQGEMNRLFLDRLYVITGRGTASASENLINGLRPYMDVILVGDTTTGKDEGSITVYDSPSHYSSKNNVNSSHKRAMQPIVFKIFNSNMQDYPQGFTPDPDKYLKESSFLENLLPLGDPDEPFLAKALDIIAGTDHLAKLLPAEAFQGEWLMDSVDLQPFSRDVYLLPRP